MSDYSENSDDDNEVEQEDNDETNKNDLYNQAIEIIKKDRKVSISYIQRKLRIGYNRAANIIEEMENNSVISAPAHNGKREILIEE